MRRQPEWHPNPHSVAVICGVLALLIGFLILQAMW